MILNFQLATSDGTRLALTSIIHALQKGGEEMRKFAIALAIVLGLNLVGSIISLSTPVSFAQEEPAPKPEKPEN
jgi:hypothetical protein